MKIKEFLIKRYRAFDSNVPIPFSDFTVLTGPNNLGKSTVLRALNLFFSALPRSWSSNQGRLDQVERYETEIDYPKRYEGRRGRRYPTSFCAKVQLSDSDVQTAQAEISMSLPKEINLTLEFVKMRDRARPRMRCMELPNDERQAEFFVWLSENFRYIYIPANRSVSDVRRSVFTELVSNSIQSVRNSKKRVQFLQQFYADVGEMIGRVEGQLFTELHQYLPELKGIKLVLKELDLLNLVTLEDVFIDDGAKTSLNQKGDGVKSLFVMSILRFLATQRFQKNLVFGIEEPEAHLHSSAIYDTKASLRALSQSFQILITTHSPILIQRDDLGANIIVDRKKQTAFSCSASVAKSLTQIRQSLGIKPQDNLTTAEVTVVVEGQTEEGCLARLLAHLTSTMSEPITTGRVRIIGAGGASKIMPLLRAFARDAASCVVLVDSDVPGMDAAANIKRSGLINIADIFEVPQRHGCSETEFEDMFPPEMYITEVAAACGVNVNVVNFVEAQTKSGDQKTRMKKWSDVMKSLVSQCGKNWEDVEIAAKTAFGKAVSDAPSRYSGNTFWLQSIAKRVEDNLKER